MQNTLRLVKDVRGCMTRFDPLTPEIVADQTEDGLTYDELKEVLEQCGMDIEKVVFDGSRAFQNAFYADFEPGHYCWIPFQKKGLKDVIRTMDQQFHSESFGLSRKKHDWTTFYMMDVPLPMQIYDFERRYMAIEPEQVFEVWSSLHTHIDYANGMWKSEVLEYVFSHAPQTEMPETEEDGLITIYRGMGEMSQDPANAISWSTDPVCALWFANRSGRGTRLVSAKVTPEQILVYNPGYRAEHEVILKPGVRPIFQYADMIPSTEGHVPRLLAPVTKDFIRYGSIVDTLGYPKEGLFMYHGIKHILRVLLLTLIYCEHSGVSLSEEDKQILIYFSLLHDMPDVSFADLRCRFQTGRSYVVSGTGRNRIYGYRNGVMCQLGDIERSEWIDMVKDMIRRSGEQKLYEQLLQHLKEHNYAKESKSELEFKALELHADRIFDNELWVDFLKFNSKYRPEIVASTILILIMPDCCKKPGYLTQTRYEENKSYNCCPHCGRWTEIRLARVFPGCVSFWQIRKRTSYW